MPGDAALAIYQHDDFDEPKHAPALVDRRARVALETEQATRRLADGSGTSSRFAAGATFTLAEHPRDAFNGDWLITSVTHHGGGPGKGYTNRFTAIPADVAFRPAQRTPKPTALGVQTAKVVGPPGEEIHTDAFGRVKVQFHWDREGQWDERSSCWIRVSQAWAGSGWGALFVPRVGTEVVVDFVEGDLDHPLILGGVYHGTNVPPYALPADRSASTFKSSSTPGGGGSNELRIEDRTGAERIYVHAERDLTVDVDRDHSTSVGNDETLRVGNDRDKSVDGDEREIIGHDRSIEVGGQHLERIAGDESITVEGASEKTVGASLTESVGANRTLSVGGTQTEVIGAGLSILVRGEKSESIEATSAETVSMDKTSTVGGDLRVSVAGTTATTATTAEEEISGSKTIRVGTRFGTRRRPEPHRRRAQRQDRDRGARGGDPLHGPGQGPGRQAPGEIQRCRPGDRGDSGGFQGAADRDQLKAARLPDHGGTLTPTPLPVGEGLRTRENLPPLPLGEGDRGGEGATCGSLLSK